MFASAPQLPQSTRSKRRCAGIVHQKIKVLRRRKAHPPLAHVECADFEARTMASRRCPSHQLKNRGCRRETIFALTIHRNLHDSQFVHAAQSVYTAAQGRRGRSVATICMRSAGSGQMQWRSNAMTPCTYPEHTRQHQRVSSHLGTHHAAFRVRPISELSTARLMSPAGTRPYCGGVQQISLFS